MSANAPPGFEPIEDIEAPDARGVLAVFIVAAERATGKPFRGFESTTQHHALQYVGGVLGSDPGARKMIVEQMISRNNTDLVSVFKAFLAALLSILEPGLSVDKAVELSSSALCELEALCLEAGSATARQLGETVN